MAIRLKQARLRRLHDLRARRTASAASGARTPTRAPRATSPPTSTRSRSRPATAGPAVTRRRPRSSTTSSGSSTSSGSGPTSASAPRSARRQFDEPTGRWTVVTEAGDATRGRPARHRLRAADDAGDPVGPGHRGLRRAPTSTRRRGITISTSTGLDVAVIGTGASAIQFVPRDRRAHALADDLPALGAVDPAEAATAPTRRGSSASSSASRRGSRPAGSASSRFRGLHLRLHRQRLGDEAVAAVADRYRERELADPELRRKATPDYDIGCKRVLISSDWYSTLCPPRRRADRRADRSASRRAASIGADGVERPRRRDHLRDRLSRHDFVAPMEVRGLGGREPQRGLGRGRRSAHLGTGGQRLPEHVRPLRAEHEPRLRLGALHARVPVQSGRRRRRAAPRRPPPLRPASGPRRRRASPREIDRAQRRHRLAQRAAARTGTSTRRDSNTNNWPGPWLEYRRRTRRLDPADYEFVA